MGREHRLVISERQIGEQDIRFGMVNVNNRHVAAT